MNRRIGLAISGNDVGAVGFFVHQGVKGSTEMEGRDGTKKTKGDLAVVFKFLTFVPSP